MRILKKFWSKNRRMTLLSAAIPVISLLVFSSVPGLYVALVYMYLVAPCVLLPFLGYKFKKSETSKREKKSCTSLKMNGVKYDEKKLVILAIKSLLVVVLSVISVIWFNKFGFPFAEQLALAGPYLLIHGFFFIIGEPLSIIKSIAAFSGGSGGANAVMYSSNNDAFPRPISNIKNTPTYTYESEVGRYRIPYTHK